MQEDAPSPPLAMQPAPATFPPPPPFPAGAHGLSYPPATHLTPAQMQFIQAQLHLQRNPGLGPRAQPMKPAVPVWLESLRTVPRVRERFTFTGSSNRFMAYETDFGWGAPSRVELLSLFAMELVLLLGAQDGGVQVTATLRPEHMEAFASNLGRFSGRGDGRRLRIGRP